MGEGNSNSNSNSKCLLSHKDITVQCNNNYKKVAAESPECGYALRAAHE